MWSQYIPAEENVHFPRSAARRREKSNNLLLRTQGLGVNLLVASVNNAMRGEVPPVERHKIPKRVSSQRSISRMLVTGSRDHGSSGSRLAKGKSHCPRVSGRTFSFVGYVDFCFGCTSERLEARPRLRDEGEDNGKPWSYCQQSFSRVGFGARVLGSCAPAKQENRGWRHGVQVKGQVLASSRFCTTTTSMSGNKRPSASQGSKDQRKKKKYRSDGTPIWGKRHIEGPGVWITCVKGKEKQAAGEACELFNNLASEIWPDLKQEKEDAGDDADTDDGEELSIEEQIAKEVNAMKQPKSRDQLFKNCPTDTACLVFISCQPPVDPVQLVYQHVKNVEETGVTHTRQCLRFSPISASCSANMNDIETLCRSVLTPAFSGGPYKFKVELKLRNHTVLARDPLLAAIAKCIPQDAGHSVDLGNPDLVILVEIFKSVCGVSVVREYQQLKKYNVAEIATARKVANEEQTATRMD
ncbi:THUMP domain-containing protein [Mycena kentingensis (nom. inval.)]|nr:THUMP domain-containing protein [Mycena kentingensis (nom. inval.)]